jgi:hypothetical protein
MRILHRLAVVAVTSLLGGALLACGDDDKQTAAADKPAATLKGDGFSVKMPGSPKREVITAQTAAGPVPITAYITEGGDEGFSLSVLKVPEGVKGDLAGAVQGAASSVEGTLREDRPTRHQGFAARDARITNAADQNGNKGTVFARVILAGDRVFQLQFVTSGADVKSPPAAYTRFVSSLKIG